MHVIQSRLLPISQPHRPELIGESIVSTLMTLADDLQKSGGIPQPVYKVLMIHMIPACVIGIGLV
jgi:hypothetical protein